MYHVYLWSCRHEISKIIVFIKRQEEGIEL